jgi:hypothetical protein
MPQFRHSEHYYGKRYNDSGPFCRTLGLGERIAEQFQDQVEINGVDNNLTVANPWDRYSV